MQLNMYPNCNSSIFFDTGQRQLAASCVKTNPRFTFPLSVLLYHPTAETAPSAPPPPPTL